MGINIEDVLQVQVLELIPSPLSDPKSLSGPVPLVGVARDLKAQSKSSLTICVKPQMLSPRGKHAQAKSEISMLTIL